jgi:hypothetical protein
MTHHVTSLYFDMKLGNHYHLENLRNWWFEKCLELWGTDGKTFEQICHHFDVVWIVEVFERWVGHIGMHCDFDRYMTLDHGSIWRGIGLESMSPSWNGKLRGLQNLKGWVGGECYKKLYNKIIYFDYKCSWRLSCLNLEIMSN